MSKLSLQKLTLLLTKLKALCSFISPSQAITMFSLVLCINISICFLTGFTLPNERKAEEVSDAKDCLHHSLTLISIKNTQPHIIFAMNQCTCVFS